MLTSVASRGFTIIELLVGVTLIGVLLALGAPAMSTYLQNSKIGNVTASYHAGLQAARSEAIRRNVRTEFMLTSSSVSMTNLTIMATPSATGPNWFVRAASGASFLPDPLDSRAGAEGEGSTGAPAVQVNGAASGPMGPVAFSGTIGFNGLGGTADGLEYRIDVSNPAGGTCAGPPTNGSMRCKRITVRTGGQIAVCDPAALTGDSRAC